ncbi:MAG: hypothetical protein L3J43_07185 [Sulfurovum sp.]|nr:hypothetical protein [Sulfurovum sp.]
MKIILLTIFILTTFSFSDVTMKRGVTTQLSIEELKEIEALKNRHTRPTIRHITAPVIIQDNYYHTNQVSNCDRYLDIIAQKDKEIARLKNELYPLRAKEQARLSKVLKAKDAAELEKFENRKSSVPSKNNITISKEPIK